MRLVESGVRLVTFTWYYVAPKDGNVLNVWDNHGGTGSIGGITGYQMLKENYCLPSLDQGFSALMEDLSERGMLDDTLVAMYGEFGRTPKINPNKGRDHWGACQSVVLAGGGIRGGQVYGSSDEHGAYPKTKPVSVEDLHATMFHSLGLSSELEIHDNENRPYRISEGQPILWWSPDPRMVLLPAQFRLHRSLRKTLQRFQHQPGCELRFDTAFADVIRYCASIRDSGTGGTWILPQMQRAYLALHQAGFAHSVETWVDGSLVGGLYCVAIGRSVFGESMFSLRTDASKIALAALIAFCRVQGIGLVDCQQNTGHLASMGAQEISRSGFQALSVAGQHAGSPEWHFEPLYWQSILPDKPTTL